MMIERRVVFTVVGVGLVLLLMAVVQGARAQGYYYDEFGGYHEVPEGKKIVFVPEDFNVRHCLVKVKVMKPQTRTVDPDDDCSTDDLAVSPSVCDQD